MEIVILNQAKKISLFEIFFVFYFLYNLKRSYGAYMGHLFQIIVFTVRVKIYRWIVSYLDGICGTETHNGGLWGTNSCCCCLFFAFHHGIVVVVK
jgi:hypothetical protein